MRCNGILSSFIALTSGDVACEVYIIQAYKDSSASLSRRLHGDPDTWRTPGDFMIRSVSRFVLIAACLAAPVAAHAQAPWRQVYKDADVTVIFDTATVTLQSPGTWNTVTSWDYVRP